MTYTYELEGEEIDFSPIEAENIHAAAREVRRLLARTSVWASGTKAFTAKVTIKAADGGATVKMPVECNWHPWDEAENR